MEFDLVTVFFNQGVAIAMLIYFIFRFERILRTNTEAITELKTLIKYNGNTRRKR